MLNTIQEASKDVFENSFGIAIQNIDKKVSQGTTTSIKLESEGVNNLTFVFEDGFLRDSATVLGVDSDKKSLEELACELTNLVAGKAKVILKNKGNHCEIGTPNLINQESLKSGYADITFCSENGAFRVSLGKDIG